MVVCSVNAFLNFSPYQWDLNSIHRYLPLWSRDAHPDEGNWFSWPSYWISPSISSVQVIELNTHRNDDEVVIKIVRAWYGSSIVGVLYSSRERAF